MHFRPRCRLSWVWRYRHEVSRPVFWCKCAELYGELTEGSGFPETPVNVYQNEQRHDNMYMYRQENLVFRVDVFQLFQSNSMVIKRLWQYWDRYLLLSQRRGGSNPMSDRCGNCVDRVPLGQIFFLFWGFLLSVTFHAYSIIFRPFVPTVCSLRRWKRR
jgi:hypothetical protein